MPLNLSAVGVPGRIRTPFSAMQPMGSPSLVPEIGGDPRMSPTLTTPVGSPSFVAQAPTPKIKTGADGKIDWHAMLASGIATGLSALVGGAFGGKRGAAVGLYGAGQGIQGYANTKQALEQQGIENTQKQEQIDIGKSDSDLRTQKIQQEMDVQKQAMFRDAIDTWVKTGNLPTISDPETKYAASRAILNPATVALQEQYQTAQDVKSQDDALSLILKQAEIDRAKAQTSLAKQQAERGEYIPVGPGGVMNTKSHEMFGGTSRAGDTTAIADQLIADPSNASEILSNFTPKRKGEIISIVATKAPEKLSLISGKPISQKTKEKITDLANVNRELGELENELQTDPDIQAYVGKAGGTWSNLVGYVTGGAGLPESVIEFKAKLAKATLLQVYAYSGKTININEIDKFKDILGDITNDPKVLLTKFRTLREGNLGNVELLAKSNNPKAIIVGMQNGQGQSAQTDYDSKSDLELATLSKSGDTKAKQILQKRYPQGSYTGTPKQQ